MIIEDVDFLWTTDCINAKCAVSRIRGSEDGSENWLNRDKFKHFMAEHYPSLMVNFDPDVHKAVQITFFSEERNKAGRVLQKGSVSVTQTGLFWLYGFQQMQFANDTADMMQQVINVFRTMTLTTS